MKKTEKPNNYQYICRKISDRIKPDGVLCESVWKDIETIVLVRNDGERLDPAYSTQAQICRDDENLYIRFLCKDPHIWATMKGRNEPLWEEEVVEVFIDPDGDGRNYIELEVNPLNNILALLIPGVGAVGNWKENADFELSGLKTYVSQDGQGWLANIIIPFRNFKPWASVPPKGRDIWHLNLYRVERPVKQRPQDCILIAWSPTLRDTFHVPQSFGEVVFAGETIL
jgi:hypothetical protein